MSLRSVSPSNNAKSLEIELVGRGKIKFMAVFSPGAKTEATMSWWRFWKRFYFLRPGQYFDLESNLARVCRRETEVAFYFKPVNGCDLVVVPYIDLLSALLGVWLPSIIK